MRIGFDLGATKIDAIALDSNGNETAQQDYRLAIQILSKQTTPDPRGWIILFSYSLSSRERVGSP